MRFSAGLTAGSFLLAIPLSAAGSAEPTWPDAHRLEAFLLQADVVERTKIGGGITDPSRVTLEFAGMTRPAIFKTIDSPHDSWRHEVAAYELDKILSLGMVPPTVERKLRGRRGCLQLWVEGVTMAALPEPPPDLSDWRQQVSMMWLFDDLVANTDRHLRNVLVSSDHRLMLIDNSRAFKTNRRLLHDLNGACSGTRARFWMTEFDPARQFFPTTYRPEVIERLKSMTEVELTTGLGRYILGFPRYLVLERRDLILRKIQSAPASQR